MSLLVLLPLLLLPLLLLLLLLVVLIVPPKRAEALGKEAAAGALITKACTFALAVEVVVKAKAAQRQQ